MTPEHRDVPGQAPDNVSTVSRARDFFSVPAPIKRIFDRFPLVTYPSNDLPHSAWSDKRGNRLYVFTDAAGARHGRPSFNPQCLKWQVRTRKCSIALVLKYITNLIPLCVSPGILKIRWDRRRRDSFQQPCISLWRPSFPNPRPPHQQQRPYSFQQAPKMGHRASPLRRGAAVGSALRGICVVAGSPDTKCLGALRSPNPPESIVDG